VEISAPDGVTQYKGFMLEARGNGSSTPIGVWTVTDPNTQHTLACSGTATAATQSNYALKERMTLLWTAPSNAPSSVKI